MNRSQELIKFKLICYATHSTHSIIVAYARHETRLVIIYLLSLSAGFITFVFRSYIKFWLRSFIPLRKLFMHLLLPSRVDPPGHVVRLPSNVKRQWRSVACVEVSLVYFEF